MEFYSTEVIDIYIYNFWNNLFEYVGQGSPWNFTHSKIKVFDNGQIMIK